MGIMQLVKGAFSTVFTNEAGLTANRSITIPDSSGTMLLDTTLGGKTLTLGTAQASTSGTSIDFTGIPSWVKRITVMFNGVSTNGVSPILARVGISSGFVTSGYSGALYNPNSFFAFSVGFQVSNSVAAGNYSGQIIISLQNITTNSWVESGAIMRNDTADGGFNAGSISLAGTLDRIRITTVNGIDAFDAGSINIMYEG